ncbi:zinc/cadmium/mercury/lead-transporting ATPase [Pantoea stewartii]|uniref:zinc/cadmium/mercury/lead-transporting ATPase n=1 Tax=Pantoea stewartii TaxID=66269 RepID=UPI0013DE41B3|nr:zinc/cadmium/mercury/lead-transporting ATPase [Pantoea stewartii]QIE97683.1 zinc/cadmium/mercury/lead-transporting ATPase [Pantoea stewartii]
MHQHHACGCGKPRNTHRAAKPLCAIRPVRPGTLSITAASPETTERASCGGDCSCSAASAGEASDEGDRRRSSDAFQFSWQVSGMDCPSCARAIETAVRQLPDVLQVRVVFSSEKLVVNARAPVQSAIEDAVINAGFHLSSTSVSAPAPSPWRARFPLLLLAALMVASAALTQVSAVWGDRLFILTTLVGLVPVARKSWQRLRTGSAFTIETLMTLASAGALLIGAHAEAAMVLLLFLLGEKLEAYAATRARSGVSQLMALRPEFAVRLQNGTRSEVPLSALQPGDRIVIAAGGRLPVDGCLLAESASFDESALTGESVPVLRQRGEKILAGATSVDRLVELEVVSRPGESAIDRILQLIEEAESHRAPVERFIDNFSRIYTPAIMLLALLVMVLPPLFGAGAWLPWVYKGLTLLLIGCPCALVISTPAAITSGLAAAARRGALIKGGAALERLSTVQTIAFDKTGTLTEGRPQLTRILPFGEANEDAILQLGAAVEQGSTHPLATAIVAAAQSRALPLPSATQQQALAGSGIQAEVDGQRITLLAPSYVSSMSPAHQAMVHEQEAQGETLVMVLRNGEVLGALALRDKLRSETPAALQALKALGINSLMLTGDNPRAAAVVAQPLGIAWHASLLPAGKVEAVRQLSEQQVVAMVGDGINDAPAMKAATLGIAMGSGADVALETADAALTRNQLSNLAPMIALARRTRAIIRQNIGIALGLKALFLVTTLAGLTGLWLAVLADSGATALVTANALRLLRTRDA